MSNDKIKVSLEYDGNSLDMFIDNGTDMDFAMLFWMGLVKKFLADRGLDESRLHESVQNALNEVDEQ